MRTVALYAVSAEIPNVVDWLYRARVCEGAGMTTLERLVTGFYDKKISVKVSTDLHDLSIKESKTPRDLRRLEDLKTECYESVLPILGIIIKKHFALMQPDDLDDLISLGALEYWKVINGNKPPRPYSDSAHFNFYFKVGIRAMIKAMQANKCDVFDLRQNNALPPIASFNFMNPDHGIFLKELPQIVFDQIMGKVRFRGKEYEVCEYIAKCMVFRDSDVKRFQIRNIGGKITNAQFFEEYVGLLYKQAMEELKSDTDIAGMLTDEGSSLNPAYYMTGAIF